MVSRSQSRKTVAALILTLILMLPAGAQTDSSPQPVKLTSASQLFTTPDESSPPIATLGLEDTLYPVAETIGSQHSKWYLVKTQSGLGGWIKAGNSDDAKRMDDFFRSLPDRRAETLRVGIPSVVTRSTSSDPVIVPILMIGSTALVTARLNRTVQALMILDTGASYTVVSRQIAANLRLNEASRVTISTANGSINVPLARLESITVGAAEIADVPVVIHDVSSNPTVGGLIGLDFLSRFYTSIDSRRKLLVLAPR